MHVPPVLALMAGNVQWLEGDHPMFVPARQGTLVYNVKHEVSTLNNYFISAQPWTNFHFKLYIISDSAIKCKAFSSCLCRLQWLLQIVKDIAVVNIFVSLDSFLKLKHLCTVLGCENMTVWNAVIFAKYVYRSKLFFCQWENHMNNTTKHRTFFSWTFL